MSMEASDRWLRDLILTGATRHDEQSCAECEANDFETIRRYVAYAVDHQDSQQTFPAIWRHLQLCEGCRNHYERLLHDHIEEHGLLEVYRETGEGAAMAYAVVGKHLRRCATCKETYQVLEELASASPLAAVPAARFRPAVPPQQPGAAAPKAGGTWLSRLIARWEDRTDIANVRGATARSDDAQLSEEHSVQLRSLGRSVIVEITYDQRDRLLFGSISPATTEVLEKMVRLYQLGETPQLVATARTDMLGQFEFADPIEPERLILTIALTMQEEPLLVLPARPAKGEPE